jgi:hypothetical protein
MLQYRSESDTTNRKSARNLIQSEQKPSPTRNKTRPSHEAFVTELKVTCNKRSLKKFHSPEWISLSHVQAQTNAQRMRCWKTRHTTFCIQDCFTQSHKYRYSFFSAKFKSYVTSTRAVATGSMLTRLVPFYILLTVHLVMILGKWPNWCTILSYVFISILFMFRATSCSSSGESIVLIQHLVYVTPCRWPSGMQVGTFLSDLHTKRSPTQSDIYQILYWYNCLSWWWAQGCSKHEENSNKYEYIEKNCASSWSFTKNQTCSVFMGQLSPQRGRLRTVTM